MRNIGLTKMEKKNPLGLASNGMSDKKIVENLKEIDFLTDKLALTRRGKEYVMGKLKEMDNVERIMIERYILEHHEIDKEVEYKD